MESSKKLLSAFVIGNFADAAFVPAAGKFGAEPCFDDRLCGFNADDPSAHCKHVGIIMLTGQFRGKNISAECAANAANLVCADRNTDAGAADEDSAVKLAGGNSLCGGKCDVGIIHTVG